ncbi:MAG: hypothetical protein II067_02760 [Agathobacter sp.]|nr:hypothetical protein [Agathobacter sp.]MBQ1681117.1 hypothetical protein [Agathobacter sp.]
MVTRLVKQKPLLRSARYEPPWTAARADGVPDGRSEAVSSAQKRLRCFT